MRKSFSRHRIADLMVLAGLSAFVIWYLVDSYLASPRILNLILILPVTAVVLLLCLIEFLGQIFGEPSAGEASQPEPVRSSLAVISLFSAYVLTLKWLGFDVGTCIFLSVFLWLQGERRLRWNLGYAICFALLVSLLFSKMLPYPMPMLVLPTEY